MIENIRKKNKIRYEIRQKRRTIAKMSQHPEFVNEIHELQKEITELEKELEKWK